MKIVALIARIVLGLLFVLAGASGYYFAFSNNAPPPPPGLAGAFMDVFFKSHWVLVVDGAEVLAGLLLLVNRYVPLALVILAALFVNIITFHVTMQPGTLFIPLIALVLWFIVALQHRASFRSLFAARG